MATPTTSQLTWYRKPFGRRLASREYPFFTISQPADADGRDGRRRDELANLAGL
jgi:hypothetical protein